MDQVLGNLALGGFAEAAGAPRQITALLNVARERDLHVTDRLYHKVPMVEQQAIPPAQLAEAVAWLRDTLPRHRVLVFDAAGAGRMPSERAASVVVAYLCCVAGLPFAEAAERVFAFHPGMGLPDDLDVTVEAVRGRLGIPGEAPGDAPA
jgi:hypothetical protein